MDLNTLPTCQYCHRPLRPWNTSNTEYPGTLLRQNKTTCQSCYQTRKRSGQPSKPKTRLKTGTPCHECKRPLHPAGTKASDYPGMVMHSGRGLCGACYARTILNADNTRKTRRIDPPAGTPCISCQKPLRPRGTKLTNHPGTVPHKSGGLCGSCYYQTAEGRTNTTQKQQIAPAPANLDPDAAIDRRNLDNYLEKRKHRGIPPEGIDILTWIQQNKVTA